MNVEQEGSFRTRTADDGSLEVWARGWRLESQLYALIPMGLSLGFLLAPMSLGMRVGGAVVMLAASLFVFRMTKPGIWLRRDAVTIVSVWRTQRFPWERVTGFMGERRHDEARILMVLEDDQRVVLPGTLDPAELDPYGEEGQLLSAADQLNRLRERALADDLPKPATPVLPTVAPSPEGPSRKERRSERKALRAALKSVKVTSDGASAKADEPVEEPSRPRRLRRKRAEEEPLTPVTVTGSERTPAAAAVPPPRKAAEQQTPGLPSYFPKPTYIPQEEYARMLREQKAAEKAAREAAAELARLADVEDLDDLAKNEAFSDWTS
jgi:hypothetical protein